MNFKEHAEISRKTWSTDDSPKERRIQHAKLGLIDELGEIASCLKKNVGYGDDLVFTQDKAINRNLENERRVLEK